MVQVQSTSLVPQILAVSNGRRADLDQLADAEARSARSGRVGDTSHSGGCAASSLFLVFWIRNFCASRTILAVALDDIPIFVEA